MIDYHKEVAKITSGITDISNIQIMNRLHYGKYAFTVNSNFYSFNRLLSSHTKLSDFNRSNLISITKRSLGILKEVYGEKWEKFESIELNKNFGPDQYDKFIDYIKVLQDMKISKHAYSKYVINAPYFFIKMPKDSDHLQQLIDLQAKSENDKSFIKIKYRSGEPYDKEYPVKSTVILSSRNLLQDEIDYLIETFETSDGIKLVSKSLRNKMKSGWPISTTIYAKSPDCFNHFVFMLKPYNIKFVKTEVFQ